MEENDFVNMIVNRIRNSFKNSVRAESHEIGDIKNIMVPMSDGTRLRTIVCFPKGKGPWPVIFTRTPYPHNEPISLAKSEEYAKRGYVSIFQYCRGTGGSEGVWVPNENERRDGIDAINWLAEQEWCSSIGIYGFSYSGLTAWIIADKLPEKVKTIYLAHYSVDRYLSLYKDGLFCHDILTAWTMENSGYEINVDYIKSCLYRPHINVDEKLWGVKLPWYRDWLLNTDYQCEYWQSGVWKTLREMPKKVKVPMCIVAGWYDHHQEGTILGYDELSPEVKAHSRLVIGGWNHFMVPCIDAHETKNAKINDEIDMFQWFEKILMERKLPDAEIKAYMVGNDEWVKWDKWPIVNSGQKVFNLTGDKRESCNSYRLSYIAENKLSEIKFDYNPENPIYSHGADTLFKTMEEQGSLLQYEPGYRDDVLSFVSEPISEDMCIIGEMNVKLFVSSDCEDTSFTVKVMEVKSNGKAYNIRSSITTLAYRNNSSIRLTYEPGEVVEVNIKLLPITWNIRAGSRLRIDVSCSDFPQFAIHSNYVGNWAIQEKVKVAHQTIYCGGKYKSLIEIPIK
ncbi:CocE/NonD family hydrolase [Clostridium sp. SYSU_GA19001]|uniref:CocE/NonD family hydrolase n=1 Tax=Clostridium caldaquaticum TaxID=2940653 RepID=UPI0020770E56|nr:CocE/NonD family hydrolase [Clostridium caldaquaticum]MCM8711702.1 CocE/NonD family hydrolase [Clostridium caldaquaticum]